MSHLEYHELRQNSKGRFGSYTEMCLAAAQGGFSLVVPLIACITLFTCIFWNLLCINMGLCIYTIGYILLGVTVSVLLELAGLSSC